MAALVSSSLYIMYLVQFVFGLDGKIPVAEVGWTSYLPKGNPIFLGIGIGAVRSRSHMADSRYYFSMYTPTYVSSPNFDCSLSDLKGVRSGFDLWLLMLAVIPVGKNS